ncbi:MAG: HAD family hydrolase [Clostridia bacterium]|nr:HAD family hydrolase [Clostridia bacterium]
MELIHSMDRLPRIRLLILDLDGTIADTVESIREAVNRALKQYGLPERSYEEIRNALGNGASELVRRSLPTNCILDEKQKEEMYQCYHRIYGETYSHCQGCYEGIPEGLRILKERGYTLAVLSNKQDVYVKALIDQLLPKGTMAMTVGQTEQPKKPDPTVPLVMARELGFSPEETAFVGDSEVDIQTAINAGMLAVGCAWGYRCRTLLVKEGAAVLLEDTEELTKLFK